MENKLHSEAFFLANISHLIVAETKKQALEKAACHLNKASIRLAQITLQNNIGISKIFAVSQVEEIDWYDVEYAEYSNQFRVFGRIQLSIFLPQRDNSINEIDQAVYNLPDTLVYENPVLVISEGFKYVFLTVLHQMMEWKTMFNETMPLGKLA